MRGLGLGQALAIGFVMCLSSGFVAKSEAATFTAITNLGGTGCRDTSNGTTPQIALCPNVVGSPVFGAYAESGLGSLKTSAYATLQRDPITGSLLVSSSTVDATAIINDTLSFGIAKGTFELSVDLLGKLNVMGSLTNGGAAASGSFSYSLTSSNSLAIPSQNFAFSAFGDIFGSPGTVSNLDTYVFNFGNGTLGLNGVMRSAASCGISSNCVVETSFENSLRFIGGIVRDVNGNVVKDGFLGSSSGFDYAKGVQPHNSVATVPLPAGLPLFLVGLGAFGAVRASRKA